MNYLTRKRLEREAKQDERIKTLIKEHLVTDEVMAIVFTLVSLRAEFMYNFTRKVLEDAPTVQWQIEREREALIKALATKWKDKSLLEIETMVDNFYSIKK